MAKFIVIGLGGFSRAISRYLGLPVVEAQGKLVGINRRVDAFQKPTPNRGTLFPVNRSDKRWAK